MHNLLTEEAQKDVIKEYRFRFLSVLSGFFTLVFVVGSVLLVPSYMLVLTQKSGLKTELEIAKKLQEDNGNDNFSSSARSVEDKIKILSSVDSQNEAPDLLFRKIMEEMGESVKLNDFSYTETEGQLSIKIDGVAKNRDELLAFRNRLRQKQPFTSADFPVELLAKDEDIRFSMEIK